VQQQHHGFKKQAGQEVAILRQTRQIEIMAAQYFDLP